MLAVGVSGPWNGGYEVVSPPERMVEFCKMTTAAAPIRDHRIHLLLEGAFAAAEDHDLVREVLTRHIPVRRVRVTAITSGWAAERIEAGIRNLLQAVDVFLQWST